MASPPSVDVSEADGDEGEGEWNCVSTRKGRNRKSQGYAAVGTADPPWRGAQAEAPSPSAKTVEEKSSVKAPVTDRWAALGSKPRWSDRTPTPPPRTPIEERSTPTKQRAPLVPPWLAPAARQSPSAKSEEGNSSTNSVKEQSPTDRWAALDPTVRWPESDRRQKGGYARKPAASPKFKPANSPKLRSADEPNLPPAEGNQDNPRRARDDVNDEIRWALDVENSMLKRGDFDTRSSQTLHAIHQKGGRSQVHEAMELVFSMTVAKSREDVKNWPGYVSKLLKNFLDDLNDEILTQRKTLAENITGAHATPTSQPLAKPPAEITVLLRPALKS